MKSFRNSLLMIAVTGLALAGLQFDAMAAGVKRHGPMVAAVTLMAAGMHFGLLPTDAGLLGVGLMGVIRPFPVDPKMTAVAIAYRNPDIALIADEVLPITPVAQEFKHFVYDVNAGFTMPDAKVGRKSQPNQVEFGGTEVLSKTEDYGYDDLVPNEDIEADNQGIDPLGTANMFASGLLDLAREVRVAGLVFNAATYPGGNQVTLSGTSQWSDQVNSDPVKAISDALDVPIMRPNAITFGQQVWTAVRRHPKVVQACNATAQGAGLVSRKQFADLFELQNVFVGQGFVNTAKKGQAAALARVWGKHCALFYRDRAAGPQAGVTFGYNGRFGTKFAGTIDEPKVGLKGSQLVRVGERTKEVIAAPAVAYYFQNAIA